MNNINFSKLVIDEFGKPTKLKSSMYIYYIAKENQITDTTSIVLTSKIMDRFDPTMKDKPPEIFPENESYLRIRLTVKDEDMIHQIQEDMARMIALYNANVYYTLIQFQIF